jgi:hypothetical protein
MRRVGHVVLLELPVSRRDTYSQRSSTGKLMSETSGGTALKVLSAGGSRRGWPVRGRDGGELGGRPGPLSRYRNRTEPDRSSTLPILTKIPRPGRVATAMLT